MGQNKQKGGGGERERKTKATRKEGRKEDVKETKFNQA